MHLVFGVMDIMTGALIALACLPMLRKDPEGDRREGSKADGAADSGTTWESVNRYGARHMIRWCVVLVVLGVLLLLVPPEPASLLFWLAPAAPLLVLIPAWQTLRYARRVSAPDR